MVFNHCIVTSNINDEYLLQWALINTIYFPNYLMRGAGVQSSPSLKKTFLMSFEHPVFTGVKYVHNKWLESKIGGLKLLKLPPENFWKIMHFVNNCKKSSKLWILLFGKWYKDEECAPPHTGLWCDTSTCRGLCHCLLPDYAQRCQTSTLIMVPIKFWQNSDPF